MSNFGADGGFRASRSSATSTSSSQTFHHARPPVFQLTTRIMSPLNCTVRPARALPWTTEGSLGDTYRPTGVEDLPLFVDCDDATAIRGLRGTALAPG